MKFEKDGKVIEVKPGVRGVGAARERLVKAGFEEVGLDEREGARQSRKGVGMLCAPTAKRRRKKKVKDASVDGDGAEQDAGGAGSGDAGHVSDPGLLGDE